MTENKFNIGDTICNPDVVSTDTIRKQEIEPVSEDLEDYAKKESESFAEREYEIDYIDKNALEKGYYWGCIAGAQWQKEQIMKNAISMDVYYETEWDDIHKFLRKNLDGEKVKLLIIKEE